MSRWQPDLMETSVFFKKLPKLSTSILTAFFILFAAAQPAKASEPSRLEIKSAELVIFEAIENTLQDSTWASPSGGKFKSDFKNFLKFKQKNKAIAFCADWDKDIHRILNGEDHFAIYTGGRTWKYSTERQAKINAKDWCERSKKKSYGCDCEVIWANGEFSPSKNLAQIIKKTLSTKKVATTSNEVASATNTPIDTIQKQTQTLSESNVAQPIQVDSSSSAVTTVSNENSVSTRLSSTYTKWRGAQSVDQAQRFANEIQASIVMFKAVSDVIEKQPLTMKERVLSVVGNEITRLQAEKMRLQEMLSSRFSTPIRPQNANLTVSAFRAADTFPKIPFYVPGTAEIGEMLVIPRVTDDGYLIYQFDFLDPTSTYDKVRDTIEVAHSDIQSFIVGLHKVDEWTKVAQQNNVNRRIEKTSSCIPKGLCSEKKQGVSSTEIVFQIYEDGSTAGRIQRNKGKFAVGYNMSVESSILLSAYLTYMKEAGSKEFNIGVMSDKEVEKLFE